MKTILVTGAAGYIGSVLVRQLLQQNHRVVAVDVLRSGGDSLVELLPNPNFTFHNTDVLDASSMQRLLSGVDAIVHLAAIVGDPACAKEPELARRINFEGSRQLFELAKAAGVANFVFASTCSNYGKMKDASSYVDETSELRPVSLYAETKVAIEKLLLATSRSEICAPTILRFSTVYGLSPRVRFDLTVNQFCKELALGRKLTVFGEQFWRPYCHVTDLARSVISVLGAPRDVIFSEVFNVGDTDENYTKQMIVDAVLKRIKAGEVEYVHKNEDPRDYRVNFDKIRETLGFRITRTVPDGIVEIANMIEMKMLSEPDDARYYNT